jgi:hypothetical protein
MKKKATLHPFLKMAGVKSEKEFYNKYPTDEDFFAAHPQAKYGMMMAQNGYQIGQFIPGLGYWDGNKFVPNPPAQPDPNWHPPMTDPNEPPQPPPPPPPPSGDKDGDGVNNPPLPGAKKPKGKRSYKVSVGDKTWNPFAKDNAWNTGQGVATTDMIAGGLGMVAGALPFQPAKQNKNVLQPAVTTGNYGYGSEASFEDGGNISPTKAREMLHNPPHGKDLTEKQRRYFGAIASGYAADGGPMLTNVPPSPYTYFRPMTKTNRQKMDLPNYEGSNIPVAQDGWASGIPGVGTYQAPVTDQEREDWNRYQAAMKRQPGSYVRNWQHNQDFQKQMAQQTGFDYNRAGAIQADMQARSQSMPGSVTGIQGSDPWGGDPNWVGDRERQKSYTKYEYLHYDPKGNLYPGEAGHKEASFTPMTKEQMGDWQNSAYAKGPNQWVTNSQGIGIDAPQSEIDKLYQPGAQGAAPSAGDFASSAPVASSAQTRAKAFPTMEQAKAAHAKKKAGIETRWNADSGEYEEVNKASKTGKATASVDDSGPGEEAYSIDALRRTGRGSEEARYGKQMIPGMYHPDHDMEMLDQYPHKMGGMYKPYSHTYTMAQGGHIPMGEQGLQVEGNQFRYLSPQTIELVGPKHENGGIDIAYNGNKVEAEGGETFHVDNNGMWSGGNMAAAGASMNAGIVGGNLYVPGTRTKFKDAFKDLAGDERRTAKVQDKASYFLNEYGEAGNGPTNKFRAPAFNYGKVLADMYEQGKAKNELVKNSLTEVQNKMLELGGMIDPEHGAKKVSAMFKGNDKWKAKWGTRIAQDGAKQSWDGQPVAIIDFNTPPVGVSAGTMPSSNTAPTPFMPPVAVHRPGFPGSNTRQELPELVVKGTAKKRDAATTDKESNEQSLAKRNNNPGNIRFVPNSWMTRMGAVEGDNGFAKFPDVETGLKAIQTQLQRPLYKDLDVDAAINQWTGTGGYQNIDLSEFKGKKVKDLTDEEMNKLRDKITMGEDSMKYKTEGKGKGKGKGKSTPAKKLDYKIRPDEFDPNMDPGITGEQPKPTPYEFDPSKSGVVPEPEHPAWGYKPDGSKMTPEEMQKNLTDRKKKDETKKVDTKKGKGMRNKFHVSDYLGEFATMFDQPEPVQSMQVQPYLEPEYNVSLQQKKNAIQSAFAPAMRAAKTPAQQAAIAAQMAEQLGAVDSEEFNFNQQNRGQILGRNLAEMRGVRDMNMKLAMDAIAKTDAARENTRENRFRAAQSFGSKEAQRRAQNLSLGMEEQYAGWQQDPDGTWHMLRSPYKFESPQASVEDFSKSEETTTKKKTKKGDESTEETKKVKDDKRYGGPMAYFGDYFPGIQRVYFAGGAVGGGMGHGGMHGMPGHSGSMASRYSPGGDTSYYEKKKKKKKTT